ncbi:hypothetical protein [Actinokineospora diospyrosa]|uniref:Uncharacterized protein n=1 Tax=Actinokineospora diospyrosa TaxID=103728 RepID=A0ABT1I8B3_9PSEU|nr:hypothetical protein [Actinokineospora diospyrosa]MCP2268870.1 hypothetical protein [Actinokineospora diospyrosa]
MVAYAAVSAAVGTVLLVTPKEPQVQAYPVYIYTEAPTPPAASTTTGPPSPVAMPIPDGYQRVAGPGGLITTIPTGWTITRSSGPGAMQATDPTDPTRYVRYGGSAAPAQDLVDAHVDYELRFAEAHRGFQRLSLGTTTYHKVPALDWEFEHDSAAGRRHAHSMYWRVGGTEYFLYASSQAARWSETAPIYRTMVDNTTP